MKTIRRDLIYPATTYAAVLTAAHTLNERILSKIPVPSIITENATELEQLLHTTDLTTVGTTLASLTAGGLMAKGYKEWHRKSARIAQTAPDQKDPAWERVAKGTVKYAVLPLSAAALAFGNNDFAQNVYESGVQYTDGLLDAATQENLSGAVRHGLGVAAAVATLGAYPYISKKIHARKHGPIVKRVIINNKFLPSRDVHVRNAKRSWKWVRFFKGREDSAKFEKEKRLGTITSYDMTSGTPEEGKKYFYSFSRGMKDKRLFEDISAADVSNTLGYLSKHAKTQDQDFDLTQITRFAKESKLYKNNNAVTELGIDAYQAERIVTALNGTQMDALTVDPAKLARKINKEPRSVSPFRMSVEEQRGKARVASQAAYVELNSAGSYKNSKAFNSSYPESGRAHPFLAYRILRGSSDDIEDNEHDDAQNDDHHFEDASQLEEWAQAVNIDDDSDIPAHNNMFLEKKRGLRNLNLGSIFTMEYARKNYEIDTNVARSFPLLGGHAVRRYFDVMDDNNEIVGALYEQNPLKKLFDRDWVLDIYDKSVAKEQGLDLALAGFAKFAEKQHKYEAGLKKSHRKGVFVQENITG